MSMLLEQFRIFAVVAEHLSITRASRELHISQPAVSKNLRHLEEVYKLRLHRKTGRGIELTDAGARFLPEIAAILSQVEQLKETFCPPETQAPDKTSLSTLSVGGGYAPSAALLPSLLSIYNRKHRAVKIDLHTGSTELVERWLENGEVEIAIVNRKVRSQELASEPVTEENLIAFVRPKHPLGKKPAPALADLNRFSFVIGGGPHGRSFSERALRSLKCPEFHPRISVCTESVEAIKTTVKSGNGIGLLYRDCVRSELRRGEFIAIHPPGFHFKCWKFLVFPRNGKLSREAADFIEVVRNSRSRPRQSLMVQ
jgi:DNA-binding transcriptional LysR family regulator